MRVVVLLIITLCLIVFLCTCDTNAEASDHGKTPETLNELPHPQKLAEMLESHVDNDEVQKADALKQVYGEELGENSGFGGGLVTSGSFSMMVSSSMR